MIKAFRAVFVAVPVLIVAGCASLNPAAVANLAGFNPLEADPAVIAVAAVVSKPLRLRDGDAVLRVKLDVDDPEWRIDESISLEIVDQPSGGAVPFDQASERVQIARIAENDQKRLAAAQAKARAYKAAGLPKGKGSLSVGLSGGCVDGVVDNGRLTSRMFMKTRREGSFFPLTRTIDLRKIGGGVDFSNLPDCAAPKGPRLGSE